MSDIVLSSATRANLLALQNTTSMQATVQNRLATGKKVTSALDNATSFFTAAGFTNRATSLTTLLDSMSTGVQTLQAANNGITSITKLVAQLRSTAQQALQSTSAFTAQAKLASSTSIAGATAADIRGSSAIATANNTLASLSPGTAANVTSGSAFSTLTPRSLANFTSGNTVASPASAFAASDTLTITVGGVTTTASYDATATDGSDGKFKDIASLKAALNRNGNADFTASEGTGADAGKLVVKGADPSKTLTVGGTNVPTKLGITGSPFSGNAGSQIRVNDGTTTATFTYDTTATASDPLKFSSISDLSTKMKAQGLQAKAEASGGNIKLSATNNNNLTIDNGAAAAFLGIATTPITGTAGDVLTLSDGMTTKSYIFDSNATTSDPTRFKDISDLNAKLATDGIKASATDNSGKLRLQATNSTTTLTVGGSAQGSTKLGLPTTIAPTGSGGVLDGKTMTFTMQNGDTTSVTFGDPAVTPGAIKTLDDFNTKLSGIGLSATLDGTGNFTFATTVQTASQIFSISGTATGVGSSFASTQSSGISRGGSGADARDNFVVQYNNLLTQIDTLSKDAGFNGINLLAGDTLSLIFNEKNTSRLDIAGTSTSSSGLGLNKVSALNFNDGNSLGAVLSNIDRVSSQLQTQASRLGSQLAVTQTRQDFTKQMVNTLQVGADNLVNADMNEEGANLLALNTQQQLSQQALSLATQSSQAVLRLLQG